MTIIEEWARTAPSGSELDRVCAEWMGFTAGSIINGRLTVVTRTGPKICSPSSRWSDAGPLLEAMKGCVEWDDGVLWTAYTLADTPSDPRPNDPQAALATTPQLAIARACAVLAARGITREQLEAK